MRILFLKEISRKQVFAHPLYPNIFKNQSAVVEIRLDSANIAEVLVNGDVINFEESLSYQFQG